MRLQVAEPTGRKGEEWDFAAIPARPVLRQDQYQNPTLSERSAERELQPQWGVERLVRDAIISRLVHVDMDDLAGNGDHCLSHGTGPKWEHRNAVVVLDQGSLP